MPHISCFHKGAYAMIGVRGNGDRRETVRYEEDSARSSLYPLLSLGPASRLSILAKTPRGLNLGTDFAEFIFQKLSENCRKGSLWTLEGAQNDATSAVSAPFVPPKTRALGGGITIYQTVSLLVVCCDGVYGLESLQRGLRDALKYARIQP